VGSCETEGAGVEPAPGSLLNRVVADDTWNGSQQAQPQKHGHRVYSFGTWALMEGNSVNGWDLYLYVMECGVKMPFLDLRTENPFER
jgi:hypothetical protein